MAPHELVLEINGVYLFAAGEPEDLGAWVMRRLDVALDNPAAHVRLVRYTTVFR